MVRLPAGVLGLIIFALSIFSPLLSVAQVKYTPEDEFVENMVKKGVAYLLANPMRDHGEAALAALAIVESTKRYERMVPTDHPLVQHSITKILEDVELSAKGSNNDIDAGGIYYCCLAIILLL